MCRHPHRRARGGPSDVEWFAEHDIHIQSRGRHAKDGPSAGITIATRARVAAPAPEPVRRRRSP